MPSRACRAQRGRRSTSRLTRSGVAADLQRGKGKYAIYTKDDSFQATTDTKELSHAPSSKEIAFEILLQGTDERLHPLLRRSSGVSALRKEILEQLRSPASSSDPPSEELAALGERVVELEELEDIIRWQFSHREERQAALRKLLLAGIDSPQSLMRALTSGAPPSRCLLNDILSNAGFRCFRPQTIAELIEEVEVRVRHHVEVTEEGSLPVLVTAPHNIYLLRDGQPPHLMEEYTTFIAQRIARQLSGACLSWTRSEQYRSEIMWLLAEHQKADNQGDLLDPHIRDPNYLCTEELSQNYWFRQMLRLADQFRDSLGRSHPLLHVDVHGCRDPPCTPSHLTVGLAAMRQEADAGRGACSPAKVEAFGAALEAELSAVLRGLDLRPRCALVRILAPSFDAEEGPRPERLHLSGAWAPGVGRLTQSQQAVTFGKFTHSCQLEMSKALRRALYRDDTAIERLARALNKAWLAATTPSLPKLPRSSGSSTGSPGKAGSTGIAASARLAASASSFSLPQSSPVAGRVSVSNTTPQPSGLRLAELSQNES